MAEGDGLLYNNFLEQLLLGAANLHGSAVLKIALVTGYTYDETDAVWSDVSALEESGTGYTTGGNALASPVVAQDDTNNRATLDATNQLFTALDVGTPSHAILRCTSPDMLIACWELGRASNGGNYTLQWNEVGLLSLTRAGA
jgi:hypothetical protein